MTRATRRLAALAAAALFASTAASASASTAPKLSSDSAIVIDAKTGSVLFAQRPNVEREIASTTKLMTAHLVLERARLGDVFTAPAYHAAAGESVIGLRKGEVMTVHDLLRALLLPSANDAAWDLAYNLGHGSVRVFVRRMNREARALGLGRTHYENPIGLDDSRNHSSARDLARLASVDMRERAFAHIVGRSHATLRSGSHVRSIVNRNDLVGRYGFVDGVKSGHTQQAGYVLVGAAHRRGARVISVVLGEPSLAARDKDSIALLRYGLAQYKRATVVKRGQPLAGVPIHEHGGRAKLAAATSVTLTVRRNTPATVRLHRPRRVDGPLPAHRRVGWVDVVVAGRVVRRVPLVTVAKVPGPSFWHRAANVARDLFLVLGALLIVLAGTLVTLRARALRRRRASSPR